MIDFLAGVPGKLKAIYDYLTTNLATARAAKIDNLDAAITTRAPASTALSTSVWTGTKAGYLDAAISGRLGAIKTVHHISGTIAGNQNLQTISISPAVDPNKTLVLFLGYGTSSVSGMNGLSVVLATNGASITAHSSANNYEKGWSVQLVEFNN